MPRIVRAFHGTTLSSARAILSGNSPFRPSANAHDWLGHGIYFFEESQTLALDWAIRRVREAASAGNVEEPAVIGADLQLDDCLDLASADWGPALGLIHQKLAGTVQPQHGPVVTTAAGSQLVLADKPMPGNTFALNFTDCAVVDALVQDQRRLGRRITSKRSAFAYGSQLYQNSYLLSGTHVQIAVMDLSVVFNAVLVYPPSPPSTGSGLPTLP